MAHLVYLSPPLLIVPATRSILVSTAQAARTTYPTPVSTSIGHQTPSLLLLRQEIVPDQRGSRVTPRVAQVYDERQVAVVDGDAGEVDDARDALLYHHLHQSSVHRGKAGKVVVVVEEGEGIVYLCLFGELEPGHGGSIYGRVCVGGSS